MSNFEKVMLHKARPPSKFLHLLEKMQKIAISHNDAERVSQALWPFATSDF